MDPRYDCTRDEMIVKAKAERNPSYSPDEQVYWMCAALIAWSLENGVGYDFHKVSAEAKRIVRDASKH